MMLIRKLFVFLFLFLLPLVGVILQIYIADYISLAKWDFFNIFLSVFFALTFFTNKFAISKSTGLILIISILLQEIFMTIINIEGSFGDFIGAIPLILYKFLLGIFIFYILFKPTFKEPIGN
jgi:hypothetical protein